MEHYFVNYRGLKYERMLVQKKENLKNIHVNPLPNVFCSYEIAHVSY